MYNFIRYRYLLGRITADEVRAFVPRYITAEQYTAITGDEYKAGE
jgi:hypothetical protein